MLKNSAGRVVLTKPNPKRSQGRETGARDKSKSKSKRQETNTPHRGVATPADGIRCGQRTLHQHLDDEEAFRISEECL